ncbi:MAG: hypothetical protein IPK85_06360 [Gemmatimonadetes bacterium]|nr:hypothetical protein [Gemmatimonadota bacterium]
MPSFLERDPDDRLKALERFNADFDKFGKLGLAEVARFVEQHPGRAAINAERGLLQLMSCDSVTVLAQVPLSRAAQVALGN